MATTTNHTCDDFPARLARGCELAEMAAPPLPARGVRLDAHEEAALFGVVADGPEEDDDAPFPTLDELDDYSHYQLAMDAFLAGRGPLPE